MSDSLMGIRKFRTLNVMDDCSREALAIEIDTSLSSKQVIRTLEHIITHQGKPMQNGYIERFNRLYREAILDACVFMDLEEVRYLTREWI